MKSMKAVQYLDAAKVKLGIKSDYELARRLRLTPSAVSAYRQRGSTFDATTALKIAEILEIDVRRVIADAELERDALSPDDRELWRALLGKVVAIAGAVGLAIAYPAECVAAVLSAVCKIAVRTFRRLAAASLPSAAALFYPARP